MSLVTVTDWNAVTWTAGNIYEQAAGTTITLSAQESITASNVLIRSDTPGTFATIDANDNNQCLRTGVLQTDLTFQWMELTNCNLNSILFLYDGDGLADDIRNLLVEYCWVHESTRPSGTIAHGISIWGIQNIVRQCLITDIDDDGLRFTGTDNAAIGNVIQRVGEGSGDTGDCIQIPAPGDNSIVARNYLDHTNNSDKQVAIVNGDTVQVLYNTLAGFFPHGGADNASLFVSTGDSGSVIEGNDVDGHVDGINDAASAGGCQVTGNVITRFQRRGTNIGGSNTFARHCNNTIVSTFGDEGMHSDAVTQSDVHLKNNIIVDCTVGIEIQDTTTVESNNCIHGATTALTVNDVAGTADSTDITDDPLFLDESGGDYRLDAGSPCIGVGTEWWTGAANQPHGADGLRYPLRMGGGGSASLGSELVTNGTFDTDTTGWLESVGCDIASVAGQLEITSTEGVTANDGALQLAIGVSASTDYRFCAEAIDSSSHGWRIVLTADVSGTLYDNNGTGAFTVSVDVTTGASDTSVSIQLFVGQNSPAVGEVVEYDNISLKEITMAMASGGPDMGAYPVRPGEDGALRKVLALSASILQCGTDIAKVKAV